MKLDDWQIKFLNTKGDKILASGRQVGKSLICGIDAGKWALENPKQNVLIAAPTERQAYELFSKVLRFLMLNHESKIKQGKDKPTQTKIQLENESVIYCLPVGISGTGIRGLTLGRLYIDEASRVPQEVFDSIYPALMTTGGDTILLSTFNGTEGEFYNTWINKDGNYNSFTRFLVSSEDVANNRPINETWTEKNKQAALTRMARDKARWSARLYAQEYLGIPDENLLKFFPPELIKQCCTLTRPEKPKSESRHIMGVDLARLGDDASAYQILRKINQDTWEQTESIVTRKTLMTQTFDKILELNEKWNCKQIGIDAGSGSMGVGMLDFLSRETKTRNRVVALNNAKRAMDADGEKSVRLLKEDMYQNLKAMMEQGRIKLLDDDEVILSLSSVQFEVKAREGEVHNAIWSHENSDIVEALIRAAWLANQDKSLNLFATYSNHAE